MPKRRTDNDEVYVIDLCEKILGSKSERQHRFAFLRGDSRTRGRGEGPMLPVDAYWPDLNLVVEYHEWQHFMSIPHFDKVHIITASGVHRGKQRKIYDKRRAKVLPIHGISLVVIRVDQLAHRYRGRLERQGHAKCDEAVLRELLQDHIPRRRRRSKRIAQRTRSGS